MEERADVEELTAEDYSQAEIPSMEEKADIPSHDIPNIPDTEMDEITTLYDHVDDMELDTMVGKLDKIIDDIHEYVEHNFVETEDNENVFDTLTHHLRELEDMGKMSYPKDILNAQVRKILDGLLSIQQIDYVPLDEHAAKTHVESMDDSEYIKSLERQQKGVESGYSDDPHIQQLQQQMNIKRTWNLRGEHEYIEASDIIPTEGFYSVYNFTSKGDLKYLIERDMENHNLNQIIQVVVGIAYDSGNRSLEKYTMLENVLHELNLGSVLKLMKKAEHGKITNRDIKTTWESFEGVSQAKKKAVKYLDLGEDEGPPSTPAPRKFVAIPGGKHADIEREAVSGVTDARDDIITELNVLFEHWEKSIPIVFVLHNAETRFKMIAELRNLTLKFPTQPLFEGSPGNYRLANWVSQSVELNRVVKALLQSEEFETYRAPPRRARPPTMPAQVVEDTWPADWEPDAPPVKATVLEEKKKTDTAWFDKMQERARRARDKPQLQENLESELQDLIRRIETQHHMTTTTSSSEREFMLWRTQKLFKKYVTNLDSVFYMDRGIVKIRGLITPNPTYRTFINSDMFKSALFPEESTPMKTAPMPTITESGGRFTPQGKKEYNMWLKKLKGQYTNIVVSLNALGKRLPESDEEAIKFATREEFRNKRSILTALGLTDVPVRIVSDLCKAALREYVQRTRRDAPPMPGRVPPDREKHTNRIRATSALEKLQAMKPVPPKKPKETQRNPKNLKGNTKKTFSLLGEGRGVHFSNR